MLCCGIGAAAVVSAALSGKQVLRSRRLRLAVFGGAAALLAAYSGAHLGHYLARAQANERTLLAEIMAQPICSGSPGRQIRNFDQSS